MTDAASLGERLSAVRRRVADAVAEAGRDAAEVTTIVVTKFQPASLVRELHALGVRDFGESRHQEARAKSAELGDLSLDWHFVGQLQSKKARQATEYASVVHSVDRDSLVEALSRPEATSPTEVFIQVDLAGEPGRGGVPEHEVERMTHRVLDAEGLSLLGVMAVAPLGEEPRPAFARLRAASDLVRSIEPSARFISAGMSGDFREAILEGATHLRIGTAITGNRQAPG